MSECLVGWAHVPFGKRDDDVESMIVQAANAALAALKQSYAADNARLAAMFDLDLARWEREGP